MKVVVNATSLIALDLLGELDILPRLFDEILVPTAVYEEIVIQGAGRPGSNAVATLKNTTSHELIKFQAEYRI